MTFKSKIQFLVPPPLRAALRLYVRARGIVDKYPNRSEHEVVGRSTVKGTTEYVN